MSFPNARVTVNDRSNIPGDLQRTKVGIQIKTALGPIHQPAKILCRSWQDFLNLCGNPLPDDLGWFYAKQMLDSKVIDLHISRVGNYSSGTLQGTAASATLTVTNVDETLAEGEIVMAGSANIAGTARLTVYRPGYDSFEFPIANIQEKATATQMGAALAATINGQFGFVASNDAGTITVTAPAGSGVDANGWVMAVNLTGLTGGTAATATITQFASGASGTVGGVLVATAKGVGTGYNGITILVTQAASKELGKVDLTVTTPNGFVETYKDVNQQLTTETQASYNNGFTFFTLNAFTSSATGTIPLGLLTLASGAFTQSSVTASDYVGTQAARTGWWSFTGLDLDYIANVNAAIPAVDKGLSDVIDVRWGTSFASRFFSRTPLDISAAATIQYLNGTGAYTGSPINTYKGINIAQTVRVFHPITRLPILVSAIAYAVIARAKTDQTAGKWESFSGFGTGDNPSLGFGSITDPDFIEIVNDFSSPEFGSVRDTIYSLGGTPVINNPNFGITLWGNRTLYRKQTSLLKFDSIANLALHICKVMQPIFDRRVFRATDPIIWRDIYREALPIIDQLENGINGFPAAIVKGKTQWLGDQNVSDFTAAQINDVADLQAGKYKVKFVFVPIGRTEQMELEANVYDNGTYTLDFNS